MTTHSVGHHRMATSSNRRTEFPQKRLLVVDDEEVICQVVEGFLDHAGWEIDAAYSISAARERLKSTEYGVLLCDVHMPGGSTEFVADVRGTHPATQIVMFTGDATVSSVRDALQNGAADYIIKPVRREELVRVVERALEKYRDVSGRIRQEEERESYRTRLEELLERRTIQLREAELKYRAVFDHAADAIIIAQESDGCIVDLNSVAARMLDAHPGDLFGKDIRGFLGTEVDPIFQDSDGKGHREWRFEAVNLHSQVNRTRTVQVTVTRLYLECGVCLQIIARDVSEFVELQERTELMELELLSEQRLAAIGLLASGVAHNINTPLMGIYGVAQLIKMKYPEIDDIDGVITQVDRITAIIRNLMWKSRQEQDNSFQEIDLNQMLKEELKFLESDLEFKHYFTKEYDFSDDVPAIIGRYSDFSQSIMNVVRNALDAMHDREIKKLTVKTCRHDGEIRVSIGDSGCGIPDEEREKIFMPFYTTKPIVGSTSGPTGTGLGLSTVQRLMNPYGVRFDIQSLPGIGTEFSFLIPIEINRVARTEQTQTA